MVCLAPGSVRCFVYGQMAVARMGLSEQVCRGNDLLSAVTIHSLNDARDAKQDPWVGEARCLNCGHKHYAEARAGVFSGMKCTKCHCFKSVMINECWPNEGDTHYECNCGCDVFHIRGSDTSVVCLNCGTVMTGWL